MLRHQTSALAVEAPNPSELERQGPASFCSQCLPRVCSQHRASPSQCNCPQEPVLQLSEGCKPGSLRHLQGSLSLAMNTAYAVCCGSAQAAEDCRFSA